MKSKFAADQRKMSPWPKLVYRGSMVAAVGATISACSSVLLHASSNISCIFTAAFFIAGASFVASKHFYKAQKKRTDRGLYEGGKSYKLACYGAASMNVIRGVSLCVGMRSLLLGDIEASAGIMMFSCIALGTGFILDELCEAIKDRDQRREDGSLGENKEGKNSGFLNILRNFTLIAKSGSNQNSERDNLNESEEGKALNFFRHLISSQKNNENEEYSLLEAFNQDEENSSYNNERRALISRSSHSVYGANNNRATTSVL